jgi:hypothetical protein
MEPTTGPNRLWKNKTVHLVERLDSHDVKRLMRCSVNAEKECRRADRPGQPADRTAAIKEHVSCAGTIQACLGQLEPAIVRAVRRQSPDVKSFAQALSQRLTGQQAEAAARAYRDDPLVRVVLGSHFRMEGI